MSKIFWLHIKKSAGQTVRQVLSPEYLCVDRSHMPITFIQADMSEYNDILNNFRIPLGEYQLKRALFAKKFLYSDRQWNQMHKFAFVRNPEERAVSAFKYLYLNACRKNRLYFFLKDAQKNGKVFSVSSRFDHFLDRVEEALQAESNYEPYGLHFKTHVAPMFGDVSDGETVILDEIVRFDQLKVYLERVVMEYFGRCVDWSEIQNKNKSQALNISITAQQRQKIERLYAMDYELYEAANSSVLEV